MPARNKTERIQGLGALALLLTIAGCGSSTPEFSHGKSPSDAAPPRSHEPPNSGKQDASPGVSGDGSMDVPSAGSPTQLVGGSVSIVGLTSDGWAVFREADALRAARLNAPSETKDISAKAGSVIIRGKVVFDWENVDYTANVGDLSIWTADAGTHSIGPTLYAEGLVAVADGADAVAYTANAKAKTMDLVIAPTDLSTPQVVLKSVGRGSDTTCSPSIGFVGQRLFVGSCAAGALAGNLERFERTTDGWQSTVLSTGALPGWSADTTGEKIFFESENYAGQYVEHGEVHLIDMGVSSGVMVPDGSAVLYTVSDQLRRTALPDINPIAVVTTGYAQRAAFSSGFHFALYSTKVTYDDGTKRDLRITPTDAFNPTPMELVAQPLAGLPRSCMTADENFVLYLTDMSPTGANLHIVSVDGEERTVLPGVIEAAAAGRSMVVFTDNSSDPNQYPVVADLKVLDLAKGVTPKLLEEKIVDGKTFQVDPTGTQVVYVRSGIDRDAGASRTGLFMQTLH